MDASKKRAVKAKLHKLHSTKDSKGQRVLQHFRQGETLLPPSSSNTEGQYDDDGFESDEFTQDIIPAGSIEEGDDELHLADSASASGTDRKRSRGANVSKEKPDRASSSSETDADSDESNSDGREGSKLSKSKKKKKERKTKEKSDPLSKDLRIPSRRHFSESDDTRDLYFYDLNGDQNTLVYQSLYRADVPPYFRYGKGVLGLNPGLSLHQLGLARTGHEWVRIPNDNDRKRMPRYCGRAFVRLEKSKSIKRVDLSKNALQGKVRLTNITADYLSLDVEVKQGSSAKEPDDGDEGETYEAFITRKTKELNQLTRERPKDPQAWKELIDFQDQFMEFHGRTAIGSINEKKISIYERAIKENPRSEDLLIDYLKLCTVTLEPNKVSKLWEQTVFKHTDLPRLWSAYVAYKCSNFASFSISSMRNLFSSALQMIFENGYEESSMSAGYDLEKFLLSIFIRSCVMDKQAGHSEKAVGRFQALIEFIWFRPAHIKSTHQIAQLFQNFWNSGVPKVGEDGAKGFSYWFAAQTHIQSNGVPEDIEVDETADTEILTEPLNWTKWIEKEDLLEKIHWKPLLLGGDPDEIDDEDRIVPFDVVQDFLFSINNEQLKVELVLVFLEFLGVPLPPRRSTSDYLSKERVIERENFDDIPALISSPNRNKIDMNSYRTLADARLVPFVQNVLSLCRQVLPGNIQLCEIQIWVDSFGELKKARKSCKNLLKEHRESLTLWHAYAHLEYKHQNINEALRIYDTALMSISTMKSIERQDVYMIFWKYAELYLEHSPESSIPLVVHILCSAVDRSFMPVNLDPSVDKLALTPSTRILKCKKLYKELSGSFKPNLGRDGLYFYICYMWFDYLTQNDIRLTLDMTEDIIQSYRSYELQHSKEDQFMPTIFKDKLHFDFESFLVAFHQERHICPPRLFRNHIQHALEFFPNNVYLLGVFVSSETKTNLTARIRRYFDETSPKNETPVGWIFSILYELQRDTSPHRVRSLFEKSLEEANCPSSVVLWRMYLQWDLSAGTADTTKRIFYRAIDRCPWSRRLWLESIREMNRYFETEELLDVLDLMREKELRLHTDLSIWSTLPLRISPDDEE